MTKPSWTSRLLPLAISALALLGPGAAVAQPPVRPDIPLGTDCWQTQPGTEQRLATLPAGFFGDASKAVPKPTIKFTGKPLDPKFVSDPYPQGCGCPQQVETKITWLDPHGNPTHDMRHAVKQQVDQTTKIDTCVRRTTDAKFKGKGKAVKVDIQLVALSLQSIAPLKVSFLHGPDKLYDVFVTQGSAQETGTMTFTPNSLAKNGAKGNVKLGSLHVDYDVEFKPKDGGPSVKKTGLKLLLAGTPGTFSQFAVARR